MNSFMRIAIEEAKKGINEGHGGPFGAVIVKDGEIISVGHNHVVADNDPTSHGEIYAIREACKKLKTYDLTGCDIYTTAYPCPMCFGAILWANINKIYYGCSMTNSETIGFRDKIFEENLQKAKKEKCIEIDKLDCMFLFNEYANIKDKKEY